MSDRAQTTAVALAERIADEWAQRVRVADAKADPAHQNRLEQALVSAFTVGQRNKDGSYRLRWIPQTLSIPGAVVALVLLLTPAVAARSDQLADLSVDMTGPKSSPHR